MQASNEGSEVTVRLEHDEDSSSAVLIVEDRGPGFDENERDKPVEPFYSTKSSGTGLGLAIAKSIVERHGGTIALQKAPQGGTMALVTLPLIERE